MSSQQCPGRPWVRVLLAPSPWTGQFCREPAWWHFPGVTVEGVCAEFRPPPASWLPGLCWVLPRGERDLVL